MVKLSRRLLLIMFIFCSCGNKGEAQDPQTFFRDVPKDRKGKESAFERIQLISDSLKLDLIDKGYDSLQIRIWLGTALTLKQQVVVIKNDRVKWSATFIDFEPIFYDYVKLDSIKTFERKAVNRDPKESWYKLIDKLVKYGILTLPDQNKLADYSHPMDGTNVTFEIALKNKYRMYSYHSPSVNTDIPEAKNVLNILEQIKKDFNGKLIRGF